MAIYSYEITTPASSEKETEIEVEGDFISYVNIRFPPGPSGLLKLAIFYGIKQIFPHDESSYFQGDDEVIEWQEYWKLPESPCKLIIKTVNEDDTYEHTVYVRIAVMKREESLAYQIASAIVGKLRAALSFL